MTERCVGCSAVVESMEGPIHRYMTSAPACWPRYGEVLATLYAQPALKSSLVMCVDAYAAQHPGTPNPQAISSVAVHLINLYSYLVADGPVQHPQATLAASALDSKGAHRPFIWLEPPSFEGTVNVFDLPLNGEAGAFASAVDAWARSVWDAWSAHHARVVEWYAGHAARAPR